MSTHNICFHGEIRQLSIVFGREKHLISSYAESEVPDPGPDLTMLLHRVTWISRQIFFLIFFFLIFPRKQGLTFHVIYLLNELSCPIFHEKIRNDHSFVVC